MTAFLLELGSEEIPARMQAAAAEQLRTRFVEGCKAAGLAHGEVIADATPRRLWLIAKDVAAASAASREERKGPAASAPDGAIAGFLRSTGLTRDQLEERETPKGVVLFAHLETPGRDAAAILAELVPTIVRDFQWPKSMRWGAGSAATGPPRWVRPLTGIVALLDGKVVPCTAHGIAAGRVTRGHRVHAPGEIDIERAETYLLQLCGAHVIAASAERRAIIETSAASAALTHGLSVIADAGLVAENAGLTEWPVPMLGRFDPAFLEVPREVIQLTMRTNQKYFACADAAGALAPYFVCVANLVASDGGAAIVAGNERVLGARLADAKFFWDQDVAAVKAGGLEAFLPRLGDIVFHEKLGTVADKVERVAKLARWLTPFLPLEGGGDSGAARREGVAQPAPSGTTPTRAGASAPSLASPLEGEELAALAEQAARLCKADLVSATVGEFPEVQGIAGAYLARVAGLDPRVADAIRDHYKPVGQGDDVPTAPVSVAVALADKLDTLVGFFAIGELPTGSRDPYALRRAMLGVIAMVLKNNLFLDLGDTLRNARTQLVDQLRANENVISINLSEWDLKDRKGPPPILVDCDVSNAVGFFPASADKYGGMGADGWLVWHEAYSGPKHVLFSIADEQTVVNELVAFALDRLRARLRDEGVRPGIVNAFIQQDYASNPIFDADTALAELGIAQKQHRFQQPLQIVNVVAGVRHASAALETETGIAALQAFKRVDSILSAHRSLPVTDLSFDANEPLATTTLATAVQGLTIELQAAVATRDYRKAIYEIGRFKPLIDKFFEAVMVNDPDPDVRARRLALLARFRDAANIVADFSKVEG